MANKLEVGFSRVVITPPLGTNIRGYFHQRLAEGVYDDLEVNAIAIKVEDKTAILLTVDCEDCETEFLNEVRESVYKTTGVNKDAVFIHSTHTHVAPNYGLIDELTNDLDRECYSYTLKKMVDCAVFAIKDLKPAKMGIAFSKAERIGFNRRYIGHLLGF